MKLSRKQFFAAIIPGAILAGFAGKSVAAEPEYSLTTKLNLAIAEVLEKGREIVKIKINEKYFKRIVNECGEVYDPNGKYSDYRGHNLEVTKSVKEYEIIHINKEKWVKSIDKYYEGNELEGLRFKWHQGLISHSEYEDSV